MNIYILWLNKHSTSAVLKTIYQASSNRLPRRPSRSLKCLGMGSWEKNSGTPLEKNWKPRQNPQNQGENEVSRRWQGFRFGTTLRMDRKGTSWEAKFISKVSRCLFIPSPLGDVKILNIKPKILRPFPHLISVNFLVGCIWSLFHISLISVSPIFPGRTMNWRWPSC